MSNEEAAEEDELLHIQTSVKDTSQWTIEDKKKLLNTVVEMGGSSNTKFYKNVESSLKWEYIKVDGKSAEECKAMYQKLIRRVRKYRTMQEIIADALVSIKEKLPSKLVKLPDMPKKPPDMPKKHPDMPKKPPAGFGLFLMEMAKKRPELKANERMKEFANVWGKLPKQEKEAYREKYRRLMKKYEEELKIFKQEHPDWPLPRVKSTAGPKAPLPSRLYVESRIDKTKSKHPELSISEAVKKLKDKYKRLSDERKLEGRQKAPIRRQSCQNILQKHQTKKKKKAKRRTAGLYYAYDNKTMLSDPPRPNADSHDDIDDPPQSNADSHDDSDDPQPSSRTVAHAKRKSELQLNREATQKKNKHDTISQNPIVPAQNNTPDKDDHLSMSTPQKRNAQEHPDCPLPRVKSTARPKAPFPSRLYVESRIERTKSKHPELSNAEAVKKLKEKYKTLSDKRKLKWIKRAMSSRQTYQDQADAYVADNPTSTSKPALFVLSKEEKRIWHLSLGKPVPAPPKNHYNFFHGTNRETVSHLPISEQNRELGSSYRKLTKEQVTDLQEAFIKVVEEYVQKYTDYYNSLSEEDRSEEQAPEDALAHYNKLLQKHQTKHLAKHRTAGLHDAKNNKVKLSDPPLANADFDDDNYNPLLANADFDDNYDPPLANADSDDDIDDLPQLNAYFHCDMDDPQPSSRTVVPAKRKSELQLDREETQKKNKHDSISQNPIVPAQNNTLDKDAHLSMPTPEKSYAQEHPDCPLSRVASTARPKLPLPSMLFVESRIDKTKSKHPELSNAEAVTKIKAKYKTLSDKRKLKWIKRAMSRRQTYQDQVDLYLADNPTSTSKPALFILSKEEKRIWHSSQGKLVPAPPMSLSDFFHDTKREAVSHLNTSISEKNRELRYLYRKLTKEEVTDLEEAFMKVVEEYAQKYTDYYNSLSEEEMSDLQAPGDALAQYNKILQQHQAKKKNKAKDRTAGLHDANNNKAKLSAPPRPNAVSDNGIDDPPLANADFDDANDDPPLANADFDDANDAPPLANADFDDYYDDPPLANTVSDDDSNDPPLANAVSDDDINDPRLAKADFDDDYDDPPLADAVSDDDNNDPPLADAVSDDDNNDPPLADAVSDDDNNDPPLADAVSDDDNNDPPLAYAVYDHDNNDPPLADAVSDDDNNDPPLANAVSDDDNNDPRLAKADFDDDYDDPPLADAVSDDDNNDPPLANTDFDDDYDDPPLADAVSDDDNNDPPLANAVSDDDNNDPPLANAISDDDNNDPPLANAVSDDDNNDPPLAKADFDDDIDDPQPSSWTVVPAKRKSELQFDQEATQKKNNTVRLRILSQRPSTPSSGSLPKTLARELEIAKRTPGFSGRLQSD